MENKVLGQKERAVKEEKLKGREKEAFGGLKEAPKRIVSQEGLKEGK